jgi:hypothetical protein
MSKKILGIQSAYMQSVGELGTIQLSCPLIVEMVDRINELEMAIIDFKAALRNCKNASDGVLDQHRDL